MLSRWIIPNVCPGGHTPGTYRNSSGNSELRQLFKDFCSPFFQCFHFSEDHLNDRGISPNLKGNWKLNSNFWAGTWPALTVICCYCLCNSELALHKHLRVTFSQVAKSMHVLGRHLGPVHMRNLTTSTHLTHPWGSLYPLNDEDLTPEGFKNPL